MNLQSNDFEIFGLSPAFALDRQALDERWKDLQRQAHPDRHTNVRKEKKGEKIKRRRRKEMER